MQRDGACISLWQSSTDDFESMSSGNTENVTDVLIVGGGITGVTTALQLQKAGSFCILAEAHTLCFGTTGGTTAHINTFFDTTYADISKKFGEDDAQMVASATIQARDLVENNIKQYAIDCGYAEKDGYLYSQNEDQTKELDEILEASKKPARMWSI